MERRHVETEIRAERDGRVLSGIAAPFNKLSLDLGGFVERIAPGAFRDSLRERRDVVLLHSHDAAQPLARTLSDTLEVYEDRQGLAFRATLPNSATARHIALLVQRGDISGMSIGFMVRRAADEEWQGDRPGGIVRTLKRVTLLEASTVTWPAYPNTTVEADAPPRSARARRIALKRQHLDRRAKA